MTLNRYAVKRDANEAALVEWLQLRGCMVWKLDQPCDLLIGRRRYFGIIEVKDGNKSASRRNLTPTQEKFFNETDGYPRAVATSIEDIDRIIQCWDDLYSPAHTEG